MIKDDVIERALVDTIRRAVVSLPSDIIASLNEALAKEPSETAQSQLRAMIENISMAGEYTTPLCQDTGIPLFFIASSKRGAKDYSDIIIQAVKDATREIPLRPNVVDPITRSNTITNIGEHMPHITQEYHDVNFTDITFMPKGAGSENMSILKMLTPAQGVKGIKETVFEAVTHAAGNPCPPTIVGVGVGGSACIAPQLAKKAILRPLGCPHEDPVVASLEKDLEIALNKTGIGPMGLGGRTTVLGVHIERAGCHTASLPVAVTLQCWAARRATLRLHDDGRIEQL